MALTEETQSMASNSSLIGRDEINDFEEIFSLVGADDSESRHLVDDHCPAEFTWDYEKGARPQLDRLYEKAKRSQWNGATDLAWDTEVDQEGLAYQAFLEGPCLRLQLLSPMDLAGNLQATLDLICHALWPVSCSSL